LKEKWAFFQIFSQKNRKNGRFQRAFQKNNYKNVTAGTKRNKQKRLKEKRYCVKGAFRPE
jgi:hypothetical protein